MQRTDLSVPGADVRLDAAIKWLENHPPTVPATPWATIAPASADASFRRYFRVSTATGESAVVMDAPPPQEDVRPFVRITQLLTDAGLQVPQLLASDPEQGFLLLGDLGNTTYLSALNSATDNERQSLFADAISALVQMQLCTRTFSGDAQGQPVELPRYDAALLRRELDLFPDWYLTRHCNIELSTDEGNALQRTFATLIAGALSQPTVFVHRDYMPRNLMVTTHRNPGVLDYQDAVIGPISYDVASLMRDAFITWEEPQIIDWVARYWDQARKAGLPVRDDFSEFYREFEWMGLQRHLKVLGIFARINYRDGKPKYLSDTPRFVGYVRHVAARYQAFTPLLRLFDRLEGTVDAVGYTF